MNSIMNMRRMCKHREDKVSNCECEGTQIRSVQQDPTYKLHSPDDLPKNWPQVLRWSSREFDFFGGRDHSQQNCLT